ncbi:AMP-binding protein [Robertkochia sediminum]|uniref:AMP-binding protein n=1 Tax=Robertkochia sediminum TaxID=2785326 RepID=UPI001933BEAE|nr:AMP-binding protein [Robertkochia sediminum]MBL7473400.1 AMP-binding protein [Robertkochia sediminum]
MRPTYDKLHLRFKLNGHYFSREELMEVAYSFVKEGKPYEKVIGNFLMDWLDHHDYVEVKTSGSTAKPKRLKVKKQFMVNSALASGDFFRIAPGDKALHCLPADYIAGKMMLVRAMMLGLEIDTVDPEANPLRKAEKVYDFCAMTPMQLRASLGELDHVKNLIVGGAPVSRGLIAEIQDRDTRVFETYGMTETVTHIAARPLNYFRDVNEIQQSFFRVLPGIKVSTDDRGCLVIDAPEITEETIVTNDLVDLKEGNRFEWLGRMDNLVNSGGIKLIPELIEEKFASVLNKRFFLCGMPDEVLGDKLVMLIEDKHPEEEAYWEALRSVKGLGKYEMPKQLFFVDHFEETENGKIIRHKTLEKMKEGKEVKR